MSGGGRRSMMSSRRRRRRGGPVLLVVILVAAAAATWWVWSLGVAEDGPTPAEIVRQDDAAGVSEPAMPEDRPLRTPRRVEFGPETAVSAPQPAPSEPARPTASETAEVPKPVAIEESPPSQPEPVSEPVEASASPSTLEQALPLIRSGDVVQARAILSAGLRSRTLSPAEAEEIRGTLSNMNRGMIFGPEVTPGDTFTRLYEIKSGDALSKLVNREGVKTNWRFVQRINGISDPSRIRVGQRIKLVQGPFHAEVDKASHRADVWLGEGDEAVYVTSLPVGLGEFGSTPEGAFRVRRGGKMVNPSWTNPRTGERFAADDPMNPIGEYWIGLDGIDPHNLQEQGFGIHGTIEAESIGQNRSMGCVRLSDEDIALLYEMLTEGNSVVLVRE